MCGLEERTNPPDPFEARAEATPMYNITDYQPKKKEFDYTNLIIGRYKYFLHVCCVVAILWSL